MPSLVPGIDGHVADELQRIRDEIKVAIAESGYTLEQVATFAGVARTALRKMLVGEVVSNADTLLRVMFVLGIRIEVERPKVGETPPFEVVPRATGIHLSSVESRASAKAAGDASDSHTAKRKAVAKSGSKQQRKSPRRKRVTGWSPHSTLYLVECARNPAQRPRVTDPGTKLRKAS